MKQLSRRDFLKGALAGSAAVALSSVTGMTAFADEAKGIYTPGTYSATATGIGTVMVTMTFSADAITDVVLDVTGETASIGQAAAEDLRNALMQNQSAEIDAVSGATMTSNAVMEAANKCIQQAKGEIPVEVITHDEADAAPADWLGEAPEISDADIKETLDTDFLVVGAGNGGLCAGAYATSKGYKTLVIEKGTTHARRRGWYGVCDSEDMLAAGEPPMDRAAMRRELKKFSSGKTNLQTFQTWFNESADMHKFIKECYAKYDPNAKLDVTFGDESHWPEPETTGYFFPAEEHFWTSDLDRLDMFMQIIEEGGNQILFSTPMVKLEQDDTGRVTGVIVRDAVNGKYLQFNAAKGVILATGDNGSNDKIMKHFTPEILEKNIMSAGKVGMMGMDVEGNPCNTGDGLRMGAWIGAKVQDFHAPMTHHMGGGMGITPFLQINKHGERFMNECIPGQQLENQIELQPEQTTFQIYDDKWPEQIPYMPANHGGLCYIIPEDEDESNPNFNDRQYTKVSAKAEAYTYKADTIDELLNQCGFEGEALETAKASIERYNELCKKGYDEDFGKPAGRMFPIENGPFYACVWNPTIMLVCVGGLESDENCHTFTGTAADPKRDLIPGLYVTGNVQGSRYAVEYPICFRGISHSLCVFYGYTAGKNAAQGI